MDKYKGVFEEDKSGWKILISTHSPHWFGRNSTRGVLSEAVAEALAEAKKPGAEDYDLLVQAEHPGFNRESDGRLNTAPAGAWRSTSGRP